jgi:hypothetical protein
MSDYLAICSRCGETYPKRLGHACTEALTLTQSSSVNQSNALQKQKEILEYLKVTADMAENNAELAWRIWQVYGWLESLWEGKW